MQLVELVEWPAMTFKLVRAGWVACKDFECLVREMFIIAATLIMEVAV